MIAISVSIRQHEPILHGRQLGDYSRNQVASSKILGAMVTKMVATWRVFLVSWMSAMNHCGRPLSVDEKLTKIKVTDIYLGSSSSTQYYITLSSSIPWNSLFLPIFNI